ncbi:hypothetical protein E3N88_34442 [Mikania micrantha]|uniref:Uncharacterized protein n=1 Tax=Mikania micrantha TaxID=192012 RepID=A0A5N6LYI5_9ASTR|nr:hypothetical protein E3N88_34442 [Mikania micrantha]
MEPEIQLQDYALDLDDEALQLMQHQWLQFAPGTTTSIRCRRILRMSVATPRCIDWGVPADAADLPTYRLITVEYLSTFRYRAHQVAVPKQEDEELPPDIEFSLCGKQMEMTIERFAVLLIRYILRTGDRDERIYPGVDIG